MPREFELVPFDVFPKYAGNKSTFRENILKESRLDHSMPVVIYKGKAGNLWSWIIGGHASSFVVIKGE